MRTGLLLSWVCAWIPSLCVTQDGQSDTTTRGVRDALRGNGVGGIRQEWADAAAWERRLKVRLWRRWGESTPELSHQGPTGQREGQAGNQDATDDIGCWRQKACSLSNKPVGLPHLTLCLGPQGPLAGSQAAGRVPFP